MQLALLFQDGKEAEEAARELPIRQYANIPAGWSPVRLIGVSGYEVKEVMRFAMPRWKDGWVLTNRTYTDVVYDGDDDAVIKNMDAFVWLNDAERAKTLVGECLPTLPERRIEFVVDDEPSEDALEVLARLNHRVVELVDEDRWMISVEDCTDAVMARLML